MSDEKGRSAALIPLEVSRFLTGVAYLGFLLLLVTPFVQSKQFVDSILTPKLIWFSLFTAFFILVICLYFLTCPPKNKIPINAIDVSVIGYFIYLHINHHLTGFGYISSKLSISTAIVTCYVVLKVVLHQKSVDELIRLFVPVIYMLAGITSIISLYQYSQSTFPKSGLGMTVAMGNTGAVGSYLAMLFPWMVLFMNASKKNLVQYSYRIVLILTLIVLFLSQARAAWAAVMFSSLFMITILYGTRLRVVFKDYPKSSYTLIASIVPFMFYGAYTLFNMKRDSADGRLFIWKRTMELIGDHPLMGVGFARFGSVYPEYQSSYLQSQSRNPYRFLANDINHPFNEYLNIMAELGIVGFILFTAIIFFVFLTIRRQKKVMGRTLLICYSSFVVFLTLSFFTYPLKVFSIQFLLICFFVIISSLSEAQTILSIPKGAIAYILVGNLVIMSFTSASEVSRYTRESSWQRVYEMREELSWKTRSKIFEELYPTNDTNWDFLSTYGIELSVHQEYEKAIPILQEATLYMKTSDLYTHLGISFEETGDYERSRDAYEKAIGIVPHKFFPRYRLVYLYEKMGLQTEAMDLAKTIVMTPAKVHSRTVKGIKYEIRKFVRQHEGLK